MEAKSKRPMPKKSARGFGPIHERMKGPDLPKGSRTGNPQAENLPPAFLTGKAPAKPFGKAPAKTQAKGPKIPKKGK